MNLETGWLSFSQEKIYQKKGIKRLIETANFKHAKEIKKAVIQCQPQIHGFQIKSVTEALNQDSQVMEVKRLILDPNIISPEFTHTDIDQLLYVIKGDGIAKVNSKEFPLDKESILWLESGEKYHFISGSLGLEILQATAPYSIN